MQPTPPARPPSCALRSSLRALLAALLSGCGAPPEPAYGSIADLIYILPVAAYADSDGDGTGDLNGVRAHLDYLAGLGVGTLQLLPLEPADQPGRLIPAGTGVDPALGSQRDLEALAQELHALGMNLEVQLPLNAVSCGHPWYSGALEGQGRIALRDSGGDSWFPTSDQRYYYAEAGLERPDLDWDDPGLPGDRAASITQLIDAGVDSVLLRGFSAEGERSAKTAAEALKAALHVDAPTLSVSAAPTEPVVETMRPWTQIGAVADLPRALAYEAAARDADVGWLHDVIADWGANIDTTRPFLGDGDRPRLASRVRDEATRRTLMTLHLLGPGAPSVYYGEELDLQDSTTLPVDAPWRGPMPWSADSNCGFTTGNPWFVPDPACSVGWNVEDEADAPTSMLRHVQWLIAMRRRAAGGAYEDVPSGYADVLCFRNGPLLVIGSVAASERTLFIPGEASIDAVSGVQVGEHIQVQPFGWRVLEELPGRR
jgi:glycosidase